MGIREDEKFEEDLAYGRVAEEIVANFFSSKGYKVVFAEDYGVFPHEDPEWKRTGPRLLTLTSNNFSSIEEAETSTEYIIAPDLRVIKGKYRGYVEVKRRVSLSTFDGEDIVYIGEKYWMNYLHLENLCRYFGYGDGVILYVMVDDFHGEDKAMFFASINHLDENMQYQRSGKYVAFNLKEFKRLW